MYHERSWCTCSCSETCAARDLFLLPQFEVGRVLDFFFSVPKNTIYLLNSPYISLLTKGSELGSTYLWIASWWSWGGRWSHSVLRTWLLGNGLALWLGSPEDIWKHELEVVISHVQLVLWLWGWEKVAWDVGQGLYSVEIYSCISFSTLLVTLDAVLQKGRNFNEFQSLGWTDPPRLEASIGIALLLVEGIRAFQMSFAPLLVRRSRELKGSGFVWDTFLSQQPAWRGYPVSIARLCQTASWVNASLKTCLCSKGWTCQSPFGRESDRFCRRHCMNLCIQTRQTMVRLLRVFFCLEDWLLAFVSAASWMMWLLWFPSVLSFSAPVIALLLFSYFFYFFAFYSFCFFSVVSRVSVALTFLASI